MKVVLFCGGQGMRMREYSETIPKPMVPIGYRPVLWHLMRYYAHFGHTDFILCLGYRGDVIKDYFMNYKEWVSNDFVLSEGGRRIEMLNRDIQEWTITFVETGMQANIGERLVAVREHLEGEQTFLANYADGLSDVDVNAMIDRFSATDGVAMFATVVPSQTFHVVSYDSAGRVTAITPATEAGLWINGGFFVLDHQIFEYMHPGDELVIEPFARLIDEGRLEAYRHSGFWAGMDTFKDRQQLEDLYQQGSAPWQVWGNDL